MKLKLLFSVVFACTLFTTSYAQINKGSSWVGSSFSYGKIQDEAEQPAIPDLDIRATSIQPAWGVAVKENLVVGIFGNYYKVATKTGDMRNYREERFGGGVFARRYVPVFKKFYIYGESRLGYQTTEIKTNEYWSGGGYTYTNKGWETGLTLTPGISYGITKNLQLEAGFTSLFNMWYGKSKYSYDTETTKSNTFRAGANLENLSAFTVGFRFLINKKA